MRATRGRFVFLINSEQLGSPAPLRAGGGALKHGKLLAFHLSISKIADLRTPKSRDEYAMPKMKSNSGAKKRFRTTGTGKFKRFKKGKRHLLTHKAQKRKRHLRKPALVDPAQEHQMRAMLPYA